MIRATRFDAMYGLVGLMDQAYEGLPQDAPPVLLLYGQKDQVIPARPVCRFAQRLRAGDRAIFYPNGYHFVLRDRGAIAVWRDIESWVSGTEPAGASDSSLYPCST